jgi:hypothetical protein
MVMVRVRDRVRFRVRFRIRFWINLYFQILVPGEKDWSPKTKLSSNLNNIVMFRRQKHRHLKRIDKVKADFQHSLQVHQRDVSTNKHNLLLKLCSVCFRLLLVVVVMVMGKYRFGKGYVWFGKS